MLVLIAVFIFPAAGGEAGYVKVRETADAPQPAANAAVESGPWGDVRPLDPSGAGGDQR